MSLLVALGADRKHEARDAAVAEDGGEPRHPVELGLADAGAAAAVDLDEPPALAEAA